MPHSARRRILLATASVTGLALAAPAWAGLLRTPPQALGPFYPRQLPLDNDNDLVSVAGQNGIARGEICNLHGRILDESGQPLAAARVEIWQCNAFGRYHHPGDRGERPLDPNFQGYGRFTTGSDGGYRFRTIKPVAYPGRAPHIHFAITADGQAPLVTQMYVAGAAENAGDGLLRSVHDPLARAALIVAFEQTSGGGELLARFDIVLGAAGQGGG
jgi:protocatechuate 3,4-dioxygenase beta subunit